MKSGFVSIIGLPNVGKSTILNKIIGEKISIVTSKPQTTRNTIYGIYNDEDSQIIFIDTPGLHKGKTVLDKSMIKSSYNSIRGSDIAVYVIDASRNITEEDQELLNRLKFDIPLIVCINKIDKVNIATMLPLKEKITKQFEKSTILELSALNDFGINDLIDELKKLLPHNTRFYDVDVYTTADIKFRIEELIREKILNLLKQEVPHSVLVVCEKIDKRTSRYKINCKIVVNKASQKSILIGKNGSMIKKINDQSRRDIESILKTKVELELFVQVIENRKNSSSILIEAGYKTK